MRSFLFLCLLCLPFLEVSAKGRRTAQKKMPKTYSMRNGKEKIVKNKKDKFVPKARIAAALSAVLPGAGQIYNRAYWKAPIVWAAIGGMAYLVIDNYIWYQRAGRAYLAKQLADRGDPSLLPTVNPLLVPLSTTATLNYRNEFRRLIDQYGLFLLLVWGLNVVEAAVHAHLKGFDVSPKLTLRPYPTLLSTPTARAYGMGLSLEWHRPQKKYKSIF